MNFGHAIMILTRHIAVLLSSSFRCDQMDVLKFSLSFKAGYKGDTPFVLNVTVSSAFTNTS